MSSEVRKKIDAAIAAEIQRHCPGGKWITGPATLHLAIGEAMEALLARTEAGADGLCAKHGAMWAKGCAACDRDLDQMPGPPDASPVADGAVAWSVVRVGNQGAAYDPPNTHRAFTYEKQPGNVDASRLGRATDAAAAASAGDSIDRGLALLKELQAVGFGVFHMGPVAMQAKEAK